MGMGSDMAMLAKQAHNKVKVKRRFRDKKILRNLKETDGMKEKVKIEGNQYPIPIILIHAMRFA